MKKVIANWGLYPQREADIIEPGNYQEVVEAIRNRDHVIARGNGRCYGDASLAKNVISTLKLNSILEFDSVKGTIHCQAGVLLSEILETIIPKGFFLPISPGTKFITVGGAFSSDIHGKNHHIDGVFSDHVISIKMIDNVGDIITIFPGEALFQRTAGGLGSTGIVIELKFRLKKIETAFIKQTSIRAGNLKKIFELFEQNKHFTYSVAWIDCLATGNNTGRSVLLLGEHALASEIHRNPILPVHKKPSISIPFFFPSWILNSKFVRLFNLLYYWKTGSNEKSQVVHYDQYFYPLDKINSWNKMYGRKGFVQYQFVIPKERSYEGMQRILQFLSKHQLGSFLAVLKLFGKSHSGRHLHFPMEGYTLALDIKISDSVWDILDKADDIVTELGGKVYLTKDARLAKKTFESQYSDNIIQNEKFMSDQMIRLNQEQSNVFLIIGANSDMAKATALAYLDKYPAGFLLLASRDVESLQRFVQDNNLGGNSKILYYDVQQYNDAKKFVSSLPLKPSIVLYAAGVLAGNEDCFSDVNKWMENVTVNYTGAVAILNELVNDNNPLLKRVIGISSIAGLRGRKSNFMYGSSKAGFHQYLFGLKQELRSRGITVQAVTPGFVKTKMTRDLDLKGNVTEPAAIARLIMKEKKVFEIFPNTFWKLIGLIVKYSPEFIIKKI